MRKLLLKTLMTTLIALLMSVGWSYGQTELLNEDFSSDANYSVTLGAEGSDGTSDYFMRTDGSDIGISYSGQTGFFFAGQDIDDSGWTGSASPSQLTWTGINITGYNNLGFSGLFASAATDKVDDDDYILVEYQIDGGGWNNLIAFENEGSQYNTYFLEDTDFDETGDGTQLSSTFASFSKSIAETGGTLDLRITAAVNSGGEDFAIEDFKIIGTLASSNDQTSYVDATGVTQPATANIASTTDTEGEAVAVLQFNIADAASGDGLATKVDAITIKAGPNNTADWTSDIDGGYLVKEGTGALSITQEPDVSAGQVTFYIDDTELDIPDGGSQLITLYVWLSTSVTDNAIIQGMIDADAHGFAADINGSVFAADFGTDVVGNEFTIDVTATQLSFTTQPSDVIITETITPAVEVATTDVNGSVDTDYAATDITLTYSGSGTLSGTNPVATTNGVATFSDLSIGTEEAGVTLAANGGTFTEATSATFNVNGVATITLPYYENFDTDLGDCYTYSVSGATKEWVHSGDYAYMNGFNSGDLEEDWLILPSINMDNYANGKMTFDSWYKYGNDDVDNYLSLMYSTDYLGVGDPSTATWQEISFTKPSSSETWTPSGEIDLSGISGTNVHFAYKYHYNSGNYRSWQIDDISITDGTPPAISNVYNDPEVPSSSDDVWINATVSDADGDLTSNPVVSWGTTSGDYSSGTIEMIDGGSGTYTSFNAIPAQTNGTTVYYIIIATDDALNTTTTEEYSYTVVDPATTTLPYYELFTTDLGNCYTFSVSGDTKAWEHSGDYASMNGYNSGDLEEDWLILPGINMDNYSNERMRFDSWYKYGNDDENNYLKLYYSNDYTGTGDPSSASWTEIPFTQPGAAETWTGSGNIDLSGITGTSVYFAFKYNYSAGNYRTWQIDNISIENNPPQISNIAIAPTSPTAADAVTVSADITDNGTVAGASVLWGLTSGDYSSGTISMTEGTAPNYVADATIPAQAEQTTVYYVITATDDQGITETTVEQSYYIPSTDATVTSAVYTVDDGASTISDIPIGTLRSEFESNITPADGATYEIYETDGSTIVGASDEIMDNYELEVTAEDGTTTKTYVLAIVDYDTDSYVAAPATQVPAATVSSLADTEAEAVEVFSIDVKDAGTNDGQPTEVLTLTFNAGPNNTADFANDIAAGYLMADGTELTMDGEPTVTATQVSIDLAAGELVIPDGGSKTVTGYLWLNTSVEDGTVIQWMVNQSGHGFVASTSGSTFASDFGAAVTGNEITVDVEATALEYAVEPTHVLLGENISPAVELQAVDENGNVDIDYTTDISISATGATLDGEPVVETPVEGVASFTTLSFSAEATGVTLEASSGTLSSATSASFNVIEADLYFSEYIEGSGNNKAIEIYNPTSSDIDLTPYVVKTASNGGEWNNTEDLTGTLGPNEVYVIANSGAGASILDIADITSAVTFYNGDDAIGLFNDGTMIDAIGTYQEDPGEAWDVAGVNGATEEHTLIRKDGIYAGNTNWPESAGTTAENSEWLVYAQDYFANLGKRSLGTEAEILEFTFIEAYGETIIDEGAATVNLEVVNGTDLTSLEPIMELSAGATSVPEAGVAQDFSSDVTYTVTAEDELTTKDWIVTVTEAASLSPNAEIRELSVEGMDSVRIDSDAATVDVYVHYGYEVTSVKPAVLLSGGVQSIAPDTSIAQDFSTAVVYTVTAQDGTTKDWTVSLIPYTPPVKSIYDIQYTELASGDSPEKGNIVEVRGIVTATVTGSGAGYFVQDGEGAWNGIWVLDNENTPEVGDSVEVIGTVDEYWDLTEIKSVAEFTVAASDKDLPAPTTLTALAAAEEQYESVFITIEKATTTNVDAGNGMWEIEDATGTLLVDDVIFAFTPEDGAIYTITGIAYYSYEERKILPRSAADIVQDNAPVIGTITLNPSAPEADEDVVLSTDITDDEAVTAAELYWGTTASAITNEVTFTKPGFDDTYEGTIPGQDAGTTVHYKVEAEDGYSKSATTGSYTVASGTGIIDKGSISVKAYPNPTNGRFKLEVTGAEELTVEIYNLVGKVVYTEVVKNADNTVTDINLESEAQGIYYIRVTDGEIVNTLKLLVK